MEFKRNEHSRFILWLDRTAEKNPLLWLPCVLLLALALAAEHIIKNLKNLHSNTEIVVKKTSQPYKKPFFLRAVAVTLTASFSLMFVPAASFDAFGEEYDPTIAFNEVSEDEEISDTEKPTVTEESTDTEEPSDNDEPTVTDEPANNDEPIDTEEPTVTDEPTAAEDPELPAEETVYDEGISLLAVCEQHDIHAWNFDENGHSGTCAVCGRVISGPHELVVIQVTNPTKTKTGIKKSECTICSCQITVTLAMSDHDHKISEEWSYDSARHWHSCENSECEAISGLAKHSFTWNSNGTFHWKECKCGYIDYGTYSQHTLEWKHSTSQHYQKCTECSYETDKTDHNFIYVQVDQQYHQQECTECGYAKSKARHTLSTDWQSNSYRHWQGCTVCDYSTTSAPHDLIWDSNDSLHWQRCSTCGWESSKTAHSFKWNHNDDEHWRECRCGLTKDKAGHSIDDTAWKTSTTEHRHYCASLCGFETDVGEHEWEWHSLDAAGHRQVCAVCGEKTDTVPHVFDSGTVKVQPTDTEKGTRVYTCTLCGYSYNETILELGHVHTFGTEWEHDSSKHWHECTAGDDERNEIAPHIFDDGTVTVQPTETATGIIVYVCTVCDYSYDEDIPALEHTHTFGNDWIYDSSEHWHECTAGDDERNDIAAHIFDDGTVTVQPTETAAGTIVYACTVCDYSYDEDISALEHTHSFDTDWHKNENDHWHECTACDEKTNIAPHISDGGTVTVQPTVTSSGVKSYTCRICGYIIQTESIPALTPVQNVTDPVYYPPMTVTEAPLKLPYVTNAPEVKGWINIAAYINASPDKVIIPITMNGEIEMPKEIAECIMNRNVTLRINMDGGSVWTVNGLDVTDTKTVNLRVSERSYKIPASIIDSLTGEFEPKEYRLYHNGNFGFKAALTLNIGKKYNGYYAVLYHYNTKTKQLEFVDESFVENRQVTFVLTHASYYAVAFNSISMYEDVSSGAGLFESSIPLETPAMPETGGVTIPAVNLPQIMKYSNQKRRYRILRKRRLDDMVFVF